MYLSDLSQLPRVLQKSHFFILVTEKNVLETCTSFGRHISIPTGEKGTHDIETIRNIETLTRTKETSPKTIIIEQADRLTLAAQNAFLKLLEEPGDNISFLFTTCRPTEFLPTILSRAKLLYLKKTIDTKPPDDTTLAQARILVAGQSKDLIPLATALAKNRDRSLEVTRAAISQLHQAQLTKPTPHFLARLEKLLSLEKALEQNGHIKLHIVNMTHTI